jgi:hypothetical protein
MRIRELIAPTDPLLEFASGGGTGAGAIASYAKGMGGPMMDVIRRMPAGQSFFGPAGTAAPKKPRKKLKKTRG